MNIPTLLEEIKKLPVNVRLHIIEETAHSLHTGKEILITDSELVMPHLLSEKSLAEDWLSEEDDRWDDVLK